MSDSETGKQLGRNWLHALAAVGGLLTGLFLLAGAYGHSAAVWPTIGSSVGPHDDTRLSLLLPALMLAVPGMINIIVCRAVWIGRRWSVDLLLTVDLIAVSYLAYQLVGDLQDHPIGFFLALVSSYTVLLAAIRIGLVWPALSNDSCGPAGGRSGNIDAPR